jgi:hypothetical protein
MKKCAKADNQILLVQFRIVDAGVEGKLHWVRTGDIIKGDGRELRGGESS